MKPYTVAIEIGLPRYRVAELFDDPSAKFKWQSGLYSYKPLEGEPGQPGAVSKLVYTDGRHRIVLIETVIARDLPGAFDSCYEWGGWSSTLRHRFFEQGPGTTRWECACTHRVVDLLAKVKGFFFPTLFRQQNSRFQKAFKAYCEEGRDVRDHA